jgi:hypothetical protein
MHKTNRPAFLLTASLLMIALVFSSCDMPLPTASSVQLATPTLEQVELSTPTALPVAASDVPVVDGSPTADLSATDTSATDTPATGTPAAGTQTGTPTTECDRAEFIADVTYPDNSSVKAGEVITKTWRVRNIGTCTWDNTYKLIFIRGEQMVGTSPADVITDPVLPNREVELSIKLTGPEINGIHWGVWQIHNGAGQPVLKADGKPQELSILIDVANGRGGRVTSVRTWSYTFTGTKCTNNVQYEIMAHINADGPVSVLYTWSGTNGILSVGSQSYNFDGAGSLQVIVQINPPFADPNNIRVTLTANGVSSSFTICP